MPVNLLFLKMRREIINGRLSWHKLIEEFIFSYREIK